LRLDTRSQFLPRTTAPPRNTFFNIFKLRDCFPKAVKAAARSPLPTAGFRSYVWVMEQESQYVPVLLLAAVAAAFAVGTLIASVVFGKIGRRNKVKDTPYECGMLPIGDGNTRMSVKFYLVAMLFILFDIEVVFLYPWAVVYREMLVTNANLIFFAMISFLGTLFIGYIYALKKGAFDWKS
jgi:NADH-quinone oxidoreductase subunit A